jgi:hypothetical protein
MCVSTSYTPLCASRYPSPEKAYFYMMNSFLYSRMEAGFPSNEEYFDEDVNVYLASLLTAMIYPGYRGNIGAACDDAAGGRGPADGRLKALTGRIAASDASLFEDATSAGSIRERYELYRINADSLLISLGVFRNARGKRPSSIPHLGLSDAAYIGRGKMYYSIAQSYAAQLYRKNSAIGEVLGKLSRGFERYLQVLSLMGGEYLNIFKQLSAGELYHLEHSALAIEKRKDLKLHYDQFLDIYSIYLRKKSPRAKKALMTAAREIRTLDPSFSFDVEKRDSVSSP